MLSIVIPAHNEANSLPGLLHEICTAFSESRLSASRLAEIIVVDDGSNDDTLNVLADVQTLVPQLRIIRHQRCCGQSTSLMTGIDAAVGDWIATLDADGQNDPHDIPAMLSLTKKQNDNNLMVVGYRNRRRDSAWRLLCSRVANAVRSRLLHDATPDSGCGIKLFPRRAFQRFPRFNHMHRFLPALMRQSGGNVVSMPVNHRPRISGTSHYGTIGRLFAGIIDLAGVAWLNHRTKHPVAEEMPRIVTLKIDGQTGTRGTQPELLAG